MADFLRLSGIKPTSWLWFMSSTDSDSDRDSSTYPNHAAAWFIDWTALFALSLSIVWFISLSFSVNIKSVTQAALPLLKQPRLVRSELRQCLLRLVVFDGVCFSFTSFFDTVSCSLSLLFNFICLPFDVGRG
jgi:hypothetical protein